MIESMIEVIRIFIILHRVTLKLEFFAMSIYEVENRKKSWKIQPILINDGEINR